MESKKIITLKNVFKVFDGTTVVEDFNLEVKKSEFVTFLGPSGCGKTTTLRMIAGFELPTKGEILLNGEDISNLPPYKRPINTVFQRYALFPHLDVYDNIAFGLKLKKIPYTVKGIDKIKIKENKKALAKLLKTYKKNSDSELEKEIEELKSTIEYLQKNKVNITKLRKLTNSEIDKKVIKALKIVDLEELEDRKVTTLSGGQQQRVAIARAIVNEPEILLLDEPLGALDLKMRKEMQLELKAMHKKLGITFIYVTHDQEEALTMSDTIVVMKDGAIQQVGGPQEIYNEPANAFVADFIGESNIYSATMIKKKLVRFIGANFKCVDDFPVNEKVDVVVRPEDVILGKPGKGTVDGKITTKIFKGVHYQYLIKVGKNEVEVRTTLDFPLNDEVSLKVEPANIHIMPKIYGSNIYYDSWINKHNQVVIGEDAFDCDITKLLPGSYVDEEGFVISKDGKHKYDFNDADVVAEIELADVKISDDPENGNASGTIISSIWKGDHYQVIVRTEIEEDYVLDTPYQYNEGDFVSISVDANKINLRLKGELSKYEKLD